MQTRERGPPSALAEIEIFPLVVVVGGTIVRNTRRGCHVIGLRIFAWAPR